jgi:hypothetical protein
MIRLKDIKKGMFFWESDMGMYCRYEALTDATVINDDKWCGGAYIYVTVKCTDEYAPAANEFGIFDLKESVDSGGYYIKLYKDHEIVRYTP